MEIADLEAYLSNYALALHVCYAQDESGLVEFRVVLADYQALDSWGGTAPTLIAALAGAVRQHGKWSRQKKEE